MDAVAEEERFKSQLSGKRLVCEARFDRGDVDRLRSYLLPLNRGAWKFPTLAAILTTGTGIYYYDAGDFWNGFENLHTQAERTWWGEQFEIFTIFHDSLETFHHLGGHRFVAPILAHGGVPQTCLPDFFAAITAYGDFDISAPELLRHLATHPNWIVSTDKPVRRFLEHGGEIAEDLVARLLDLWRAYDEGYQGARAGLPDRIVSAFSDWHGLHRPSQRSHQARFPRADLHLEPAGVGISLRLPRCSDHPDASDSTYWEALGKRWAASREHEIQCPPGESYEIQCANHKQSIRGIDGEQPVLFFDPSSGKGITDPKRRRLPTAVWAVAKKGSVFAPEPVHVEDLLRWPGYAVAVLNLSENSKLDVLGHQYEVRKPFFSLDADCPLQDVHADGGIAVYSKVPQINWDGQANVTLIKNAKLQGNIDIEASDLAVLVEGLGEFDLHLRGPLGESLRKHFLLVPGLRIDASPDMMWPSVREVTWSIASDVGEIRDTSHSFAPFKTTDSRLEFLVLDGENEFGLIARIPKLQWRVTLGVDASAQDFSVAPISVSVDELNKSDHPMLEMTLGNASCEIEMTLEPTHTKSQRMLPRRKQTLPRNTWYFDLRNIRDELVRLGLPDEYQIEVTRGAPPATKFKVLAVRPHWELRHIAAVWQREGDEHVLQIMWEQSGELTSGRWLVVWPMWRKSLSPEIVKRLEERDLSKCVIRASIESLRPGRYAIKAIHAPWGVEEWSTAAISGQTHVDVHPGRWQETFVGKEDEEDFQNICEAYLAYWHRPELVATDPLAGRNVSDSEAAQLIEALLVDATPNRNERLVSGVRRITLNQPNGLTAALERHSEIAEEWFKVFPRRDVVTLVPTDTDKAFIRDVAFQYDVFSKGPKPWKRRYANKRLSGPLRRWRDELTRARPSLYEVVWLCEKHRLFDGQRPGMVREYVVLKNSLVNGIGLRGLL